MRKRGKLFQAIGSSTLSFVVPEIYFFLKPYRWFISLPCSPSVLGRLSDWTSHRVLEIFCEPISDA